MISAHQDAGDGAHSFSATEPVVACAAATVETLAAKPLPKPISEWTEYKDSGDGSTTTAVFLRKDCTVQDVIKTLDLPITRRLSYMEANHLRPSPYRGSGEWSHSLWREGGVKWLNIQVDVGSGGDNDCCGSLCRLSYDIEQTRDLILLTTHRSYNL